MSSALGYRGAYPEVAAHAEASERAAFIRRTYAHLAGAILAFVALEAALLRLPNIDELMGSLFASRFSWLVVLLGFMAVAWVAESWARSNVSRGLQYLGLGLYVVAQAVIFLPMLYIASRFFDPEDHVIETAGVLTLAVFVGLTVLVFITRQDFSYLRAYLIVGSLIALGVIVASIFLGYGLGLWFCLAMVALASGYILYYTSNVLHRYRTDQHVAAALSLFAAVALLFWYILRIVMLSRGRR
jgi:FtsH-binding integral membrane protein